MKAAVLNQIHGRFDIEDIQIDNPRGCEILVEVKASGLCHSDLHLAQNDFGLPLPAVLGHEIAGLVKEIGPDVSEFAVGDHVVGSLVQWCGHCEPCQDGRSYMCEHPEETKRASDAPPRLSRNGRAVTQAFGTSGFAQFTLVHQNQLVKVPEELPFPQASILGCACVTGAGAVINTAKVKPGDVVAVVGVGGVGLNVITGARLSGAKRIIAIDIHPAKEALARKFGATDFVDAAATDPVNAVMGMTGRGVDHAFEVVGLPTTIRQTVRMARRGGGVYLIGIHKPGDAVEFDVILDLVSSQRKITGVNMGSSNIKRDIPIYADLYLQGRFNLDDLISREINILQINDAYDDLKNGAIARSVITSF